MIQILNFVKDIIEWSHEPHLCNAFCFKKRKNSISVNIDNIKKDITSSSNNNNNENDGSN